MKRPYYESRVYLCSPTNSTMFTTCCDVAICNDEKACPSCKENVYGHDQPNDHKRGMIRWSYAFKK